MKAPQPRPGQVDLMQYISNRFNAMQWTLNAFTEFLEDKFPGAREELERRRFYHKCWSFMMGKEQAKAKARPDQILEVVNNNNKVIAELRKEAISKGWIDVFHKAEVNVEREAKEMIGRGG